MSDERRMSGKQAPTGALDINAFVSGSEPEEATPRVVVTPATPPKKAPRRAVKSSSNPKSGDQKGRGVEAKEQLTERVQVKLTPSEMAKLKEQVGMVPVSVFLRKFLQDNGLL